MLASRAHHLYVKELGKNKSDFQDFENANHKDFTESFILFEFVQTLSG